MKIKNISITMEVDADYIVLDSLKNSNSNYSINPKINATKYISGGASINASLENNNNFGALNTINHLASIGIKQPLLKESFDDAFYNKEIAISNSSFTIAKRINFYKIISYISEIRKIYWQFFNLKEQLEIAKLNTEIKTISMNHAKLRYSVGAISALDTLETALALNMAIVDSARAEKELKKILRIIKREIGFIPPKNIKANFSIIKKLELTNELSFADKHNFELLSKEELLNILKLEENYYKKLQLPDLSVNAGYNLWGEDFNLKESSSYNVGLSFSYTFGNNTAKDKYYQKGLEKEINENSIKLFKQELHEKIEELVEDVNFYLLTIKMNKKAIEIAEKKIDIAKEQYAVGTINIMSNLAAQNDLINAKLNLLQTQTTLMATSISLDLITGKIMRKFNIEFGK